jgi:creatinine amidohydrolase/Fe(II)-dependent formamide hydrolase-like protein
VDTTIIVGTAGTEQKGPHMVDGEHKFVMEHTGDKIAARWGKRWWRRSSRMSRKAVVNDPRVT